MAEESLKQESKGKSVLVIILFILLVAILVPLTWYAINYINDIRTKALVTESPQKIEVTNVTSTSASISWITPTQKTVGYVKYGTSSELSDIAWDSRDKGEASGEYSLHYVNLTGLAPTTTYYYSIVVGGKEYEEDTFPFTTASISETVSTPIPLKGSVEDPTGGTEEVIVFMYLEKDDKVSNKLSALTSGKRYTFDLSNLRLVDLSSAFSDFDDAVLYLSAEGAERGGGTVETKIIQL
jgi:hypothetical protein